MAGVSKLFQLSENFNVKLTEKFKSLLEKTPNNSEIFIYTILDGFERDKNENAEFSNNLINYLKNSSTEENFFENSKIEGVHFYPKLIFIQ